MRENSRLSDKAFEDIDLLREKADEVVARFEELKAAEGEKKRKLAGVLARNDLIEVRDHFDRYTEQVPEAELAIIKRSLDTLVDELSRGTHIDPEVIAEIVERIKALPRLAEMRHGLKSRADGAGR